MSDRIVQSLWFEYKYSKNGQLREKRILFSGTAYEYEGETRDLKKKTVNRYGGNLLDRVEEGVYPIIYLLDDNDLPIERQSATLKQVPFQSTQIVKASYVYRYTYEFDAQGNWIKRTSTLTTQKDDKPNIVLFNVVYRMIVYF